MRLMQGIHARAGAGAAVAVALLMVTLVPAAGAVHFYRGDGSGCTPAAGALSDDPGLSGAVAASVLMLHNTFNDAATGLPVTVINAGEAVRWTWNSEHCHSVQAGGFYSGFHFPSPEPSTLALLPGLFHYPVPTMEPALEYTRTFDEPGVYAYQCEHHAAIGMAGVVVVR